MQKDGMFQTQPLPVTPSFISRLSSPHGVVFGYGASIPHQATGGGDQSPAGGHLVAQHQHALYPNFSPLALSTPGPASAAVHHSDFGLGRFHRQSSEQEPRFESLANYYQRNPNSALLPAMDVQGGHDMAAQQEAAKGYQPKLEGPLVGDKTTSEIITTEYAKADQVYVEKTTALPQTYSHYRSVLGDGNCGWRAIGFSYFEKLVDCNDRAQVEGEVARLLSLNHMLESVGKYDYYEDFAEEVFELLREVANAMGDRELAYALVHQKWNDKSVEASLIYYLRLLAATYLKANADAYTPFLPDGQDLNTYCAHNIEVVDREIEQLGIIALVNVLLKPVGFVLEIAYLDRSPGSQVNRYRFPEEANDQDPSSLGPMIYLLYRPGHYDILYRQAAGSVSGNATASQAARSVHINRVSGFTHDTMFTNTSSTLGAFATVNLETLSLIPGMSTGSNLPSMMTMPSPATASSSIRNSGFTSAQETPWLSPFDAEGDEQSPRLASGVTSVAAKQSPSTPISPNSGVGPVSSVIIGARPVGLPLAHQGSSGSDSGYPIRFSPHQLEYETNGFPEPTFQVTTSTFKNSVWNRAHYGNPDFQPEEWNPDDETMENRLAKKKSRKD